MNKLDPDAIGERIRAVVKVNTQLPETVANDIAFHLTDWLDDLEAFFQFCSKPKEGSNEQVEELLIAFLLHVPNHIAAAGKLYTGVPVIDVFGVGAVSDE